MAPLRGCDVIVVVARIGEWNVYRRGRHTRDRRDDVEDSHGIMLHMIMRT